MIMLLNKKNIKIKNEYIYDSLKELVGSELISETAEDVLLKYIESIHDNGDEDDQIEEIELSEFSKLNKILYSSINHNVLVDICIGTTGYKTKSYKLLSYKLSYPKKRLTFDIERKDDVYSVEFYPINGIDFHIGGNISNVWISTGDIGVRKLTFNYEKLVDDNSEACFEKEEAELPYNKFFDTDKLLYYLEEKKYMYMDCKLEERLFIDKQGNRIYLLNVQEGETDGTIYFIGENGNLGCLDYYINGNKLGIYDIPNGNSINRGIGTEAIKMLLDFAKKRSVNRIVGTLSPVDVKHRERQVHFYRKNGFNVNLEKMNILLALK